MTPKQLVSQIDSLFSLPEICLKINALVEDPKASANDIAGLIQQDADLSARLLKTVNSAFYAQRAPIETISRAITLIGTNDLRNLAIMTTACDLFEGVPGDLVRMDEFWHKSVACGALAQDIGKKCCVLHPERLLVMGVLHDIGRLVLYKLMPDTSRDVLLVSKGQSDLLLETETSLLGFTHAEVGALLLENWGLPLSIVTAVRNHHTPMGTDRYIIETAVIHVSHILADGMHMGGDLEEVFCQIDQEVLNLLGLSHDECMLAVGNVAEEVREMYAALVGFDSAGGQAE